MNLATLAVALPRLIKQLVGSEGTSLRLDNPEKYNFDPDKLLSLLIQVILVLSEEDLFIFRMNEEETLEIPILQKAQSICTRRRLLSAVSISFSLLFLTLINRSTRHV